MEEIKESVKADILTILDKVIEIMEVKENSDVYEIKNLSNHTIHSASIFQDSYSIPVAVFIYSIYKMIERKALDDKEYAKIQEQLKYARLYLKDNRIHDYKKIIDNLFKIISAADKRFKIFFQEVIEKAKINKGSKLYEHGISMSRAAELMGLSTWELMSYIGKTTLEEQTPGQIKISPRKRMSNALQAFDLE